MTIPNKHGQPFRHGLLWKAKRNHIHIHSLDVPFRQLELMNQRMSEECAPLIRLHEHALTVQPDAVRILIFSVYDFSESHGLILD